MFADRRIYDISLTYFTSVAWYQNLSWHLYLAQVFLLVKGKNRRLAKRTYLTNTSKPRCEQFSRSARRDEEIVVDTTMTRSNKAMRENRRNPSGYGHSAPDTASLLLEVASTTPASSLLVPTRTGQYRGWRYLRDRFYLKIQLRPDQRSFGPRLAVWEL